MSIIDGAFGNLHNFLHFIVLNNCVEYFNLQEGEQRDSTRRELSRALFNAVVALDSAVDHAFHSEPRSVTFEKFFEELSTEAPVVGEVRELANAMKHCVTRRSDRMDGADIARGSIDVHVDLSDASRPQVKVRAETTLLADADRIMQEAFRFWLQHAQQMDARAPRLSDTSKRSR